MRIVPKPFVDVAVGKDFYRDLFRIKCRRTGLWYDLTHEQIEDFSAPPPTNSDPKLWGLFMWEIVFRGMFIAHKREI